MILVPVLFGFYSVGLGQDINWDLKNYHLYNPFSYINSRLNVDLAPAGMQTYFNPFLDLAYFHAISALSPKTVGFLIGCIQGLSFIFIYKISSQILGKGRDIYALVAALAGILSVGFLSEVGTTLHDSLVGVISLASLWLVMSAIRYSVANDQHRYVTLMGIAGLLIGVACGLKLVFAIYALAMSIGLLFIPNNWTDRIKIASFFGICAFSGFLLVGGYWLYKIWLEFGNPLFPQFNNIFHGELAISEPIRDIRFLPKDIYEKVFYPAIFTTDPLRVGELHFRQINWIFGYVALLALGCDAVFRKRNAGPTRIAELELVFFISYFSIAYLLWLNLFGIYRYLIPLEVLIPLLIFIAINRFLKSSVKYFLGGVFVLSITLANLKGAPDWGHSDWADTVFRADPSLLTDSPEPAAVYLVGQPLAWIIPALNISAPFIQLNPNMPVTNSYWEKASDLTKERVGRSFAIFEAPDSNLLSLAKNNLTKMGLVLDESVCSYLVVYLGASRHEYRFCEVS